MPHITHTPNHAFANFHRNRCFTIADLATYEDDGAPAFTGPQAFAASAAVLKAYLDEQIASATATGISGAEWSLSPILGLPDAQLVTARLNALHIARTAELHSRCDSDASYLAFAGGGAQLRQLVDFAEGRDRSIRTSGSYLGTSIAGACATSVNGSALGFGGVQNQVRGIHLITGGASSVWVEPASRPVLNDETALQFADRIIRDDRTFADCQVHLGGMGLVNGVLFELVDKTHFGVIKREQAVNPAWLEWVSQGDWQAVAQYLGHDQMPVYYEVQVDPYDLFGSSALHTLFFRSEEPPSGATHLPSRVYDALVELALEHGVEVLGSHQDTPQPPILTDLFQYYAQKYFIKTPEFAPQGAATWGQLHQGPDGSLQGLIYTSALALPREQFGAVLPMLCQELIDGLAAAGSDLRHLIYTFRFVTSAQGTLAFTRYPETAVLDMEGIMGSPLSKLAVAQTLAALEARGEPHFPHWGKIVPPTRAQIEREFGAKNVADWIATREMLLDPSARQVLWNEGLRDWGLAAPSA